MGPVVGLVVAVIVGLLWDVYALPRKKTSTSEGIRRANQWLKKHPRIERRYRDHFGL